MTALGVAIDARVILAKHWTQPDDGPLTARDEHGAKCEPLSPRARRWTLSGALLKATESAKSTPQSAAVYAALKAHIGEQPEDWANRAGRMHAEILTVLDAVITRLKQEQP